MREWGFGSFGIALGVLRRVFRRWGLARVFLLFVMVVIGGFAGFFYLQLQQVREDLNHARSSVVAVVSPDPRTDVDTVVAEVSAFVLLPEGETPTLSTITDIDSLTDNKDFFRDAQNGDQVLVYPVARKAFLYRPSTQQLINLAPIDVTQPAASATPTPDDEPFTVMVRNGTPDERLLPTFVLRFLDAFDTATVTSQVQAARDDYRSSLVVPLNAQKQDLAQRVALELGMTVGALPVGELSADVDLLIILGADQQ